MNRRTLSRVICLSIMLTLSFSSFAADKHDKKKKNKATGTPVLWEDPGDISALDLFYGPGGEAMQPDLSHVTFIEEEQGGFSKKYRVRDGAGRIWVAKLSKEAQHETAATRLVW